MISLKSVVKMYSSPAGTFSALGGIDLEIGSGQLVALVGKSGSGKSTLLNMIGGIDRPSSGSLSVNSISLNALNETRLAQWRGGTIGFVFQFFQLLPTLTVLENVMLPMYFAGSIPIKKRKSIARELLTNVGIVSHANKLPAALSGGEQQRVAIARALANDPKVVLADEPTGNLDSAMAQEVIALLRGLVKNGKTVLIVTHDADVGKHADRLIEIADGKIIHDSASIESSHTRKGVKQ